jgi:RNA polymerase sigma-70 factor (ECF subfamily)
MFLAEASSPHVSIADEHRRNLERLYLEHHKVIWRTLRRMGFSSDAAAESTQQAFLITVQRWAEVRPGCEKAFLFSTAISLAKTTARRDRRTSLADNLEIPDLGRFAETLDHKEQVRKLLDWVLSRLEPDLIAVFSLFEVEGYTSPEIAELLDIPLGTVASRLRRSRERFLELVSQLEASRPNSDSDGLIRSAASKGRSW